MIRFVRAFSIASRRFASNGNSFLNKFMENVKQELNHSKELQESKRALEKRMRELNNSEVRKKFDKIQAESAESSIALAKQLSQITVYMNKFVSDIASLERAQEVIKQTKAIIEVLDKTAKTIGDTEAYKQVASTADAARRQLDSLADVRMYSRPEELEMRSSESPMGSTSEIVQPNTEAHEVVLHKDSKWYSTWNSFAQNNSYFNKLLDWKLRYDESENLGVRLLRGVTDRVLHIMLSSNEISEVLTEIAKTDPSFNKIEWLKFCETRVVPNILEACIRSDLVVLNDWCLERAYNQLATQIKEWGKIDVNARDSRIIDVNKMELMSGKVMEQGPVLVISFQVFMVNVLKNSEGKIVEGDQSIPVRVRHVWVMCRDLEEYDPNKAWKLLECHMQQEDLSL